MHVSIAVFLVALAAFPSVWATTHTECFLYFLKKDGCVWSAADNRHRCDKNGKPPKLPVGVFHAPSNKGKRDHLSLDRRYTSQGDNTSFPIGGGTGVCGKYDTNQPGACLWVGSEQRDNKITASTAGWLNGAKTSNCGNQLYIERVGQPKSPLYVPVVDGCIFYTHDVAVGCFQVALTNRTFYDLKPTPQEIELGYITSGIIWDFNNEHGNKPSNGPV